MTREHLYIAKTIETLSAEEVCALIEANDKNAGVPVMERLVIGAMSAPRLVTSARAMVAALESAKRVLTIDLRRMRVFGENYNQAVVDAGDRVVAALKQFKEAPHG